MSIKSILFDIELWSRIICTFCHDPTSQYNFMLTKLIMKQPIDPQTLLNTFLQFNLTSVQCTDSLIQPSILKTQTRKQELIKQIKLLQAEKRQYLNLIGLKKSLTDNLKQLLNHRQSIDYDQRNKKQQFTHHLFPYRSNVFLKQELNEQRIINSDKRKKIREAEVEVKKQQQKLDQKKRQMENNRLTTTIGQKSSKNNDCVDDFWIKRIQKMKKFFLNQNEEYKRAQIKHDYNLVAEKTNCDCTIGKVCPICSNYNIFEAKTAGYARQALLSPRYTSIYRSKGTW